MSEKKKFLLRIDGEIYEALETWAAQELRSVNGQIEFLLNDALRTAGRSPTNPSKKHSEESGSRRS